MLMRLVRRFSSSLKYTKNHEWVLPIEGTNKVKLGITNYAQEQLGEIVHVEMPQVGKTVTEGASALTIESVKVAADVYSPGSGSIVTINQDVVKDPSIINSAAEQTWIIELALTGPLKNVLTSAEYQKILENEKH